MIDKMKEYRYRQYLYCIFAIITITAGTVHESWTSPYLPKLKSEDSPIGIKISTIQSSLVVSLYFVGSFLGSIFTLWGLDFLGRKIILIVGGTIDLVSWLLIYFANSVEILYIARILGGVVSIIGLNCASIYIGEISDNDNRGKLSFLLVVFALIGSVVGLIIGPVTSYHNFAIIAASISVLAILCNSCIPESPYHLVKNKKYREAAKIVWKLSADAVDEDAVARKMKEITLSVQRDMQNRSTLKELLSRRMYRKALILHVSLKVLLYCSGNTTIKSYLQTVLNYSNSDLSSNTSSVIFGIVNLVAALLSGQVVDRFGRKPLLIFSSFVCSLALCILATYFYLEENTIINNVSNLTWLPLTCLLSYQVCVSVGIVPLPFTVAAEVYPLNVKAIAVSAVAVLTTPLGVIFLFSFEPLAQIWGIHTIFWLFCFFCLVGFLFGVFIFPETKGKSFEDIQKLLNAKSEKSRSSQIFNT